jgi:formylmethanofuran dehydrogenase subunit E
MTIWQRGIICPHCKKEIENSTIWAIIKRYEKIKKRELQGIMVAHIKEKMEHCAICEEQFEEKDLYQYKGELVCNDCIEEKEEVKEVST